MPWLAPASFVICAHADDNRGADAEWERREAATAADRRSGLVDSATPLGSARTESISQSVCVHVYIYIYIYIYREIEREIHTYIHTHIITYTHMYVYW